MAIQSFRCHDNFFHLCLDKGDIIDVIIFEGLNKPFQTSTSLKTTRLAFNLWNGTVYDSDPPETYINKDGEKEYVPSKYYAPDNIFNCTYTPYYMEALKMRFEIFM